MKLSFYILLGIALSAIIAIAVGPGLGFATYQSSNVVNANVNVGNVIYISVSPSSNTFGPVYPNTVYSATVGFTDADNGGNLAANIFVNGSDWYLSSNTFGVGNTIWSATSGSTTGTTLTNTLTNTGIIIPQPNINTPSQSNSIYFGVTIPAGTPPGLWTQNVIFENENLTASPTVNSITQTVQLQANVQSTCYITLSTNSINFGTIVANANVPTTYQVIDSDNGGNAAANVILYGTNWIGPGSFSFGVSNTVWAGSNNVPFSSANALPLTALPPTSLTPIVPQPTLTSPSANVPIYFGLGIPGGTPAGSYTQTITIMNSC